MSKKFVFVVGSTGEYSDHVEWYVAAFRKKSQAEEMVEKASKYATTRDVKNPYDPFMIVDYTGTCYHVEEVPLLDDVPVFES